MSEFIYYELPLTERIRSFLRLEFLFNQYQHFSENDTHNDSRAAMTTLLDIYNILSLTDFKKEAIKELERHMASLSPLQHSPGVDTGRLNQILDKVSTLIQRLNECNDHFGQELKSNDFLCSISQRLAIPGGTCEFDIPAYQFWLAKPKELRQQFLDYWLSKVDVIRETTHLVMSLTRQSASPLMQTAHEGFYQYNLNNDPSSQLIRVGLPRDENAFAEISGSKHRIAVRFLVHDDMTQRPVAVKDDIEFKLLCCKL